MHLDTVSHHTFPFFLYRAGPHRDLHSSLHDALPICEVPARGPEDDDGASGHVLATVVADALDDRRRTRVPDREALADETAEESLARGRPVEDRVSRDHVLLGAERGTLRRPQREHPAGQALAD